MCEVPVDVRNEQIQELGLDLGRLENITVIHHQGNTALRRHLEVRLSRAYRRAIEGLSGAYRGPIGGL